MDRTSVPHQMISRKNRMDRLSVMLADKLKFHDLSGLYVSYDLIGDIAVIRAPELLRNETKSIVEVLMRLNRHIKTVLYQASPVRGDFRLRKLEWVAGEKKTETIHKEYGCIFKVDLEKCYFSPRLSHERMRIAQQIQQGEVLVNMFSGVGCFSLVIVGHSRAKKVYSIDINPVAIQLMKENIRLNKAGRKIIFFQGDAGEVIKDRLQNSADRVLMPLPEKAYEYLDYALLALKPNGGYIHYYAFEHAKRDENPVNKIEEKISQKLQNLKVQFEISSSRVVRTIGPNWHQVVLDICIFR